jgi:hypothetical protein
MQDTASRPDVNSSAMLRRFAGLHQHRRELGSRKTLAVAAAGVFLLVTIKPNSTVELNLTNSLSIRGQFLTYS